MMALHCRVTCTLLLLSYAHMGIAADTLSVNGKLKAGMEYQSNVNISELEQASGESDTATALEGEINAAWQVNDHFRLDSSYSINDKRYNKASAYDSRLQLAFIDASYGFNNLTLGSSVYLAQADLDGSDFLTLNQFSVYAMYNLSDSWFIRPSVVYADKDFAQFTLRDASNKSANLDSFWFFQQGQKFISLGAIYEDEDALDKTFSYRAAGINIRVSNQFDLWHIAQKVQLGMKLTQRDYALAIDNNERNDIHQHIDAKWELNINATFALLTSVEYGDYQSILASADYDETRAGLMLQASF
ncbi:surface lipoprotein assembly modifier [Shewanella livingstonensis]|uniref:DUF560 domain-containing protein n=1 Tax=Shewanella livingstonensis TaxID=150120 RepID=A0A3G8LT78_9GAMM|nr:surface lipoprotein assembly modifier [Shewanella livingstonensis]AZG71958.1 DUF560 domain-containing protein [Shewanella livingstonensis]